MPKSRTSSEIAEPDDTLWLTVVGLFEDAIDANHLLNDLRKADSPGEMVSLIVREVDIANHEPHGALPVAEALSGAGLGQVGDWLAHLASLSVPETGGFLVAGPMGTILSHPAWNSEHDVETHPIEAALIYFGYGEDEAGYLANRVLAGSLLIGLTMSDPDLAPDTRRMFAERNAVHIGTSWTKPEMTTGAQPAARPQQESGQQAAEVVVLDSVAVLVGLCSTGDTGTTAQYRGAAVLDRSGETAGVIDDLLAEVQPGEANGSDSIQVRYVVIEFGGLLGIGKNRVAVPAEHVALDAIPIQLAIDRNTLQDAPRYHADEPFSRQDEELVCDHFGCPRYWVLSGNQPR